MRLIAIFGPTAVGKTAVAVALARLLRAQGERPAAVSADALQIYRGLPILTGLASAVQRRELEHRLISFLDVSESCTAGRYARLAHAEIDSLLAQGRRPIVLGGTGLYLRAALGELDMRPPVPAAVREHRREQMQRSGPAVLHAELARLSGEAAARIDPGDRQRILRALELIDAGQRPPVGSDQLWSERMRRPTLLVGLTMERQALYARIDARVEEMVAAGVRDEVMRADAAGASQAVRKALGFRELLDGDVEAMKRRTRIYAKRQLTWMRKLAGAQTIDLSGRDPEDAAREILACAAVRRRAGRA